MKIVMGDLLEAQLRSLPRNMLNARILVHREMKVYSCIGCMDCFGRRPGHCAISDPLREELEVLGYFDELELVSECVYGGLSPQVKAGLERFFAYLRPAVEVRKKETRFSVPAAGRFGLLVRMYGIRREEEQKTAEAYVSLLGRTLNADKTEVHFYRTKEDLMAGKELLGDVSGMPPAAEGHAASDAAAEEPEPPEPAAFEMEFPEPETDSEFPELSAAETDPEFMPPEPETDSEFPELSAPETDPELMPPEPAAFEMEFPEPEPEFPEPGAFGRKYPELGIYDPEVSEPEPEISEPEISEPEISEPEGAEPPEEEEE